MYMISVTHNLCTRDMLQSLSVVTSVITLALNLYFRRLNLTYQWLWPIYYHSYQPYTVCNT